MQKRLIYNQYIKALKVRLIDEKGEQIGVVDFEEAKTRAKAADLDLIQVTEKVDPPVCKIMDYGKYLYQLEKKERKGKSVQHAGEIKNIRLSFKISEHDMQTRAVAAEKFLKKGYKIRVEMVLRGREKYMGDFPKKRMKVFWDILNTAIPIKMERELKMEARGITMIVARELAKI
ncbi:MAG: translation initiation factor IF-3 [Candidatus Gribaldobacteria bacterium]|nr:translation initiation factor IF-3 [Candidatus Gribaldobacteria bacterium]